MIQVNNLTYFAGMLTAIYERQDLILQHLGDMRSDIAKLKSALVKKHEVDSDCIFEPKRYNTVEDFEAFTTQLQENRCSFDLFVSF